MNSKLLLSQVELGKAIPIELNCFPTKSALDQDIINYILHGSCLFIFCWIRRCGCFSQKLKEKMAYPALVSRRAKIRRGN